MLRAVTLAEFFRETLPARLGVAEQKLLRRGSRQPSFRDIIPCFRPHTAKQVLRIQHGRGLIHVVNSRTKLRFRIRLFTAVRDWNAVSFRKTLQGFPEREPFHFLYKLDHVTRYSASEAFVDPDAGVHVEGWRFFGVEG